MGTETLARYTALHRAIQKTKDAAAAAARQHELHGPTSHQEEAACNKVVCEAIEVAILAAELEGNAGEDTAGRIIARLVVAVEAVDRAREIILPMDEAGGHVASVQLLLDAALDGVGIPEGRVHG